MKKELKWAGIILGIIVIVIFFGGMLIGLIGLLDPSSNTQLRKFFNTIPKQQVVNSQVSYNDRTYSSGKCTFV